VTRFFDLDEANATLPEVRGILESLRDERAELIRLRDRVLLHRGDDAAGEADPAGEGSRRTAAGRAGTEGSDDDASDRRGSDDADDAVSSPRGRSGDAAGPAEESSGSDPDVRILRLRMQGVIDRMQAGVTRIDELGITLREIETGLIDFPALASGRQIWLCWRLGEGSVDTWHELGDGFGGRRPLAELT
jgi:hypothetical protein